MSDALKRAHLDALRQTQTQIDAPTYLDWTDEELGKLTRALALDIGDTYGAISARLAACAAIIHGEMAEGKIARIAWADQRNGEMITVAYTQAARIDAESIVDDAGRDPLGAKE
jgi:hypothetical protein